MKASLKSTNDQAFRECIRHFINGRTGMTSPKPQSSLKKTMSSSSFTRQYQSTGCGSRQRRINNHSTNCITTAFQINDPTTCVSPSSASCLSKDPHRRGVSSGANVLAERHKYSIINLNQVVAKKKTNSSFKGENDSSLDMNKYFSRLRQTGDFLTSTRVDTTLDSAKENSLQSRRLGTGYLGTGTGTPKNPKERVMTFMKSVVGQRLSLGGAGDAPASKGNSSLSPLHATAGGTPKLRTMQAPRIPPQSLAFTNNSTALNVPVVVTTIHPETPSKAMAIQHPNIPSMTGGGHHLVPQTPHFQQQTSRLSSRMQFHLQ
jgi:hypothetical protein